MSQQIKQSLRRAWYRLPESRMKDFVRMRGSLLALNPLRHPMLREINQLSVVEAGESADGTRFLRLADGPTFYNFGTRQIDILPCTHTYLHRYLRKKLQNCLPKVSMDMAADIVCRYLYPHADPTITPPYSSRERGTFHPQHRDTIEDIPEMSEKQKKAMREQFRIRPGDVVLDVGSYIGYGAMRLSEQVGTEGMVVSVEADCRNQAMFEKNIESNRIDNVQLIPRAIWSGRGQQEIYWNDSQLNSLVEGIVAQQNTRTIETDSVDNIVSDLELQRVSLVSLTVNGAEIEALRGMQKTLREFAPRLSIAGWYERNGVPIHREVTALLDEYGYQTLIGRYGRVYGWPAIPC